jgi:drug/metabolite transporter (DMT)-like permease
LKQLDAMQVALSNYLITFIGLPIAAIWLNEKLSVQSITGGLMVLIATLIVTVMDYKMNEKNKLEMATH